MSVINLVSCRPYIIIITVNLAHASINTNQRLSQVATASSAGRHAMNTVIPSHHCLKFPLHTKVACRHSRRVC